MKIGIITWFAGSNLGTCLQAIALQRYLRNAGYEVEVINYEVAPSKRKNIRSLWQKALGQPQKYAMRYAQRKYGHMIDDRNRKIADAITKNCILTDWVHDEAGLIKVCNSFDILVCGSDQIWNPNWYHRFYFADYDVSGFICAVYRVKKRGECRQRILFRGAYERGMDERQYGGGDSGRVPQIASALSDHLCGDSACCVIYSIPFDCVHDLYDMAAGGDSGSGNPVCAGEPAASHP